SGASQRVPCASAFLTSDCEIPNCLAIADGLKQCSASSSGTERAQSVLSRPRKRPCEGLPKPSKTSTLWGLTIAWLRARNLRAGRPLEIRAPVRSRRKRVLQARSARPNRRAEESGLLILA